MGTEELILSSCEPLKAVLLERFTSVGSLESCRRRGTAELAAIADPGDRQPTLRRNKGLIAGLIKGNQFLQSANG